MVVSKKAPNDGIIPNNLRISQKQESFIHFIKGLLKLILASFLCSESTIFYSLTKSSI